MTDGESPWAGDSISPDDRANEIDWTFGTPDEADRPPSFGDRATAGYDGTSGPAPTRPDRRPWLAAGAIATAAVLGVGLAVWSSSGDDTADDAPATSGPSTTLGDLPSAEPDVSTTIEPDPDDTGPIDEPASPELVDVAEPTGTETESFVELPAELAALDQPMEIVTASVNGDVATLSIPSGRLTRQYASDSGFVDALVVAPEFSVVSTSEQAVLIPRAGLPSELTDTTTTDGFLQVGGWILAPDGSALVVAIRYDNGPNPQALTIAADGTVEERADLLDERAIFQGGPRGGLPLVDDDGGVYEIAADGSATRLSTGTSYGSSATQVFVRECDETRQCEIVMIDRTTGDRTPWASSEPLERLGRQSFGNAVIAPNGRTVLLNLFDRQPTTYLLGVDGDATELGEQGFSSFGATNGVFTPDSAGVIVAGLGGAGGLTHVASDGTQTGFAEEIGNVATLGVRYPDAELPSTLEAVTTSNVGPIAEGTGLDLVLTRSAGGMVHIDLDSGETGEWASPTLAGIPRPSLYAAEERVIVVNSPGSEAFESRYGAADRAVTELTQRFPTIGRIDGPLANVAWVPSSDDERRWELVPVPIADIGGSTPFRVADVDGEVLGGDGAGGLVVQEAGDVFAIGLAPPERVTTGDLLAISARHAFVRECDEDLECEFRLRTRATGETEVIDLSTLPGRIQGAGRLRDAPVANTISPDATSILVAGSFRIDSETPEFGFGFLQASGQLVPSPEPAEGQPIVWSFDGRFALYIAEERLQLYDAERALVLPVPGVDEVTGLIAVDADFALPAAGTGTATETETETGTETGTATGTGSDAGTGGADADDTAG